MLGEGVEEDADDGRGRANDGLGGHLREGGREGRRAGGREGRSENRYDDGGKKEKKNRETGGRAGRAREKRGDIHIYVRK